MKKKKKKTSQSPNRRKNWQVQQAGEEMRGQAATGATDLGREAGHQTGKEAMGAEAEVGCHHGPWLLLPSGRLQRL